LVTAKLAVEEETALAVVGLVAAKLEGDEEKGWTVGG
jgi:hypothetical protein